MPISFDVLGSGLTVATDPLFHSNFVVIQVWVKAGSRSETVRNNGIAHFLEHMAFKGTHSRTAHDIAVAFDDLGASFNAHTSKENTVYYVKVLKDCFEDAFTILADIMLNSVFDDKELRHEQSVVLEEIAETNDDPTTLLFDKFIETSFPNQPLGRSILGSKETVMSFDRTFLLDFIEDYYYASNIFLIVSGNIDHGRVLGKTEELFSSLNSKNDTLIPEKGAYISALQYVEHRDLEQIHIILGVAGLSINDDLYYAVQILSIILGGSMSSRLFQEVREKRGLAYSISSFNISYFDSGVFGIYACATPHNLRELIEVTFAELRKIKTTVSSFELERAKTQLKAGLLMKMEGIMGRADYIGKSLQYFGQYVPLEKLIEKIDTVDVVKLQSVIDRIIDFRRPTLSVIGKPSGILHYDEIVSMF